MCICFPFCKFSLLCLLSISLFLFFGGGGGRGDVNFSCVYTFMPFLYAVSHHLFVMVFEFTESMQLNQLF